VKEFIDWTLSDAGQKILQDIGYVPAPKAAK
jgi:ABC-type phosphate transport system substrate-binding protein